MSSSSSSSSLLSARPHCTKSIPSALKPRPLPFSLVAALAEHAIADVLFPYALDESSDSAPNSRFLIEDEQAQFLPLFILQQAMTVDRLQHLHDCDAHGKLGIAQGHFHQSWLEALREVLQRSSPNICGLVVCKGESANRFQTHWGLGVGKHPANVSEVCAIEKMRWILGEPEAHCTYAFCPNAWVKVAVTVNEHAACASAPPRDTGAGAGILTHQRTP